MVAVRLLESELAIPRQDDEHPSVEAVLSYGPVGLEPGHHSWLGTRLVADELAGVDRHDGTVLLEDAAHPLEQVLEGLPFGGQHESGASRVEAEWNLLEVVLDRRREDRVRDHEASEFQPPEGFLQGVPQRLCDWVEVGALLQPGQELVREVRL